MTKEQLKDILENTLTNCNADIQSNDNVHFSAKIVSDDFNDLNRIKRQQLVYSKINNYIASGELHALTMKTIATNEL